MGPSTSRLIVFTSLVSLLSLPVITLAYHQYIHVSSLIPMAVFVICACIIACSSLFVDVLVPSATTNNASSWRFIIRQIRSMILPFVVVAVLPSSVVYASQLEPKAHWLPVVIPFWMIGIALMTSSIDLFFTQGNTLSHIVDLFLILIINMNIHRRWYISPI
jgi:hypothetical protein